MIKRPLANPPLLRFARTSDQRHLRFLIIGLALLALSGLFWSQLNAAHAQTATPALNYGNRNVNTTSAAQTATFTNNSEFTMSVGVGLATGTDFSLVGTTCGSELPGGSSCEANVVFSPKSAGPKSDAVVFTYEFFEFLTAINAKPQLQAVATSSTTLTGVGVLAVTPAPTRAPPACGSQIHGWVLVDGKPGVGQTLNLEGPHKAQTITGPDGSFYFNNLCAGSYKVSLVYDRSVYTAGDPDTRTFQVDGINAYRNNQFSINTVVTTAPATTAPATTAPAVTTAAPATAAPTTPAVTLAPAAPQCPASLFAAPSDNRLRLGTQTIKVTDTSFLLCVQVSAGTVPIDLSDTVIINLPGGAVVSQANANLGTVTVNTNTVRWGDFALSARQSANLVLSINAPSGSLVGSSVFVSGSFNRSQAFQQRIPGLPGVLDIQPPAQGGGTQSQGQSRPVIPAAAPATGVGMEEPQPASVLIIVLAAFAALSLGIFGLVLTGRAGKQTHKKE
ncbi:MAG: hypothetical protein JWP00_2736 [Chloroflexi bacterium]|jgi:hypothetical protein|nr:hypothetical protein [Chloroflexota bacterium]